MYASTGVVWKDIGGKELLCEACQTYTMMCDCISLCVPIPCGRVHVWFEKKLMVHGWSQRIVVKVVKHKQ